MGNRRWAAFAQCTDQWRFEWRWPDRSRFALGKLSVPAQATERSYPWRAAENPDFWRWQISSDRRYRRRRFERFVVGELGRPQPLSVSIAKARRGDGTRKLFFEPGDSLLLG